MIYSFHFKTKTEKKKSDLKQDWSRTDAQMERKFLCFRSSWETSPLAVGPNWKMSYQYIYVARISIRCGKNHDCRRKSATFSIFIKQDLLFWNASLISCTRELENRYFEWSCNKSENHTLNSILIVLFSTSHLSLSIFSGKNSVTCKLFASFLICLTSLATRFFQRLRCSMIARSWASRIYIMQIRSTRNMVEKCKWPTEKHNYKSVFIARKFHFDPV